MNEVEPITHIRVAVLLIFWYGAIMRDVKAKGSTSPCTAASTKEIFFFLGLFMVELLDDCIRRLVVGVRDIRPESLTA